jgi:hypothetical protein
MPRPLELYHEHCSDRTCTKLTTTLTTSIAIQTLFHVKPPTGFISPAKKNHSGQIELLSTMGTEYDHSSMHNEF